MRGTIFCRISQYVPGLYGEGACVAVTVAMDHPSGDFQFPHRMYGFHGGYDSIRAVFPQGWKLRFAPRHAAPHPTPGARPGATRYGVGRQASFWWPLATRTWRPKPVTCSADARHRHKTRHSRALFEMLIQKAHRRRISNQAIGTFDQPVAFVLEAQVFDGDLALAQGGHNLFGFADWHAWIIGAVDDEE